MTRNEQCFKNVPRPAKYTIELIRIDEKTLNIGHLFTYIF